jgi:dihydrofolate reductase
MIISLIAAMSENRVIGNKQELPWNIPQDLKRFKEITTGHAVIMGRKTYDSIGKALPGRENIVVTRQTNLVGKNIKFVQSLGQALAGFEKTNQEVFILGGGEIFSEALPLANRLYLTFVHGNYQGDAYFPELNWDDFSLTFEETHNQPISFTFRNYLRKP